MRSSIIFFHKLSRFVAISLPLLLIAGCLPMLIIGGGAGTYTGYVVAKEEHADEANPAEDPIIVAHINKLYAEDPQLRDDPITVTCVKGVVTLSGTIASPTDRIRAESLAYTTHGVKVVNIDLVRSR